MKESLNPKDRLVEKLPWINYEAQEFLIKILNKNFIVYEYGAGSSTLFFSQKVKKIISIEHDLSWFNYFTKTVENLKFENIELNFFQPKKKNPESIKYGSKHDLKWKNYDFEKYVESIDQYEDDYFDLVVIDGRARDFCLEKAIPKVKPGGYILFDNADRELYGFTLQEIENWLVLRSFSPTVYDIMFSQTNIYKKPL
jgi:hypothetical protein